jgi:hypothetical protein
MQKKAIPHEDVHLKCLEQNIACGKEFREVSWCVSRLQFHLANDNNF